MMAGATISANNHAVDIALSVQVWKEAATHIAYTPELDISSCGKTPSQAKSRLREAVSLFIEESACPEFSTEFPRKPDSSAKGNP
jgi:hypothetical protein